MQSASHHQDFQLQGVRCAHCIHAIESTLQKEPSVTHARVNMSTSRLAVDWQGDTDEVEHFMKQVKALGYGITPFDAPHNEELREDQRLLRAMAIAGFAMGNIMLLSFALWGSNLEMMGMATRELLHWISALIALPSIAYAGQPFFVSALSVLKHGRTNMDVPISLALVLASGMSLYETYHGGEHAYFDSAVMLLFFLLIGRWLDARARGKARENAQNLLAMMQGYATVIDDGNARRMPIKELREGMMLRIVAGERIPTDAELVDGTTEIDSSLVTGESLPHKASAGDTLFGGTINLGASITCRVLKASEDSLLADIVRLMEQAEQGRARYVRLADKAAALYTPVVHSLAACAFLGWFFIGGVAWQDALLIAITTLIITCPCALGLAVPVVQVLATGWLMKRGILVKSGDALERLARIDTIIFDKTGTLTLGEPRLVDAPQDEQLTLAASLAAHSNHPYSRAISNGYDGELLPLEQIKETAGIGIEAVYKGDTVALRRAEDEQSTLPAVSLLINQSAVATFAFEDALRDDAASTLQALHQQSLRTILLSGDRQSVVAATAKTLGIEQWQAECKPADKTHFIQSLQAEQHQVLMVGDGLNDAPSLAQADASISPATGIDMAQNSADIVFQGDKLDSVLQSWRMAVFSTRLVKQNFALAVLYNCIAIPLALSGLVTPLVAAIAMSSSSLLVIANSFRINLEQTEEY